SPAKVIPVRNMIGSVHKASHDAVRPSAVATISTAIPDSMLFMAAHTASPTSTSSSVTGAFMMASHVFWTCILEKPEYMASNDALIMMLEQTVPPARKAIYDMPTMLGSMRPRP